MNLGPDTQESLRVVALIPARSGSKRVKNKNLRPLGQHPLIAYSIAAAHQSEVFGRVIVSTDSSETARVAEHYGAEVLIRPAALATDESPDIGWVQHALRELDSEGDSFDAFSILRPTSPFRLAATIRRAWDVFRAADGVDSLRAVEPVSQHPGKMWVVRGDRLLPLLPFGPPEQPWHSSPTQSLPEIFVQNASLEIARCSVAKEKGSIAGDSLVPFVTAGWEGFDINEPQDFERAERAIASGEVAHPHVSQSAMETS